MFIDLHTHTTCSDGTLTPEELVQYSLTKKLRAVAVTDHDSVSGNQRAVREGQENNIEVIPGVELSVESDEGNLHILGLFVNSESTVLKRATAFLQKKRRERNLKILEKLNKLKIEIKEDKFVENAYLGRPNIAHEMVVSGYVTSIDEAFEKFLKRGRPAYTKREKLSEEETIEAIKKAQGIPVLAHPVSVSHPEEIVNQLLPRGLGGIEVYYPTHSPEETEYFLRLAQKYGLAVTGGSDFHGLHKPDIDLGCMNVPAHLLDELKRRLQK